MKSAVYCLISLTNACISVQVLTNLSGRKPRWLVLPTRFHRKMAGISTCVLIIHAVRKLLIPRQAIYQGKRGIALLPILKFKAKGMYTIHTTPNSCHFSAKSCRKTMKQQLYMLIFTETAHFCLRSNEMYGFSADWRCHPYCHSRSTCCFARSLFCIDYVGAKESYISFNLKHERVIFGKTARCGIAAAPGKTRGGNNLAYTRPNLCL